MAKKYSVSLYGAGLQVEFRKIKDRLEHTISVNGGDQPHAMLRSHERGNDETSPQSPPLTELHEQQGMLFLTGATALAHWSMSVEIAENKLVFDVACRLKSTIKQLGSEYRVLDANCRDILEVEFKQAELFQSSRESDLVRIEPSSSQPTSFPATIQWRYAIATRK